MGLALLPVTALRRHVVVVLLHRAEDEGLGVDAPRDIAGVTNSLPRLCVDHDAVNRLGLTVRPHLPVPHLGDRTGPDPAFSLLDDTLQHSFDRVQLHQSVYSRLGLLERWTTRPGLLSSHQVAAISAASARPSCLTRLKYSAHAGQRSVAFLRERFLSLPRPQRLFQWLGTISTIGISRVARTPTSLP